MITYEKILELDAYLSDEFDPRRFKVLKSCSELVFEGELNRCENRSWIISTTVTTVGPVHSRGLV